MSVELVHLLSFVCISRLFIAFRSRSRSGLRWSYCWIFVIRHLKLQIVL